MNAPIGKSKVNVVGRSAPEVEDKTQQREAEKSLTETQNELLSKLRLIQSSITCYSQ
jgi:hypothetical protein